MGRKRAGRGVVAKVRRRLAAAVEPRGGDLHEELAALRSELRETRESLHRAIRATEVRHRRGLFFAGQVRAAAETERFVAAHMAGARPFPGQHAIMRYALGLVSVDGMVLEFGVATGKTLRWIVDGLPGRDIFGFDVFTGLPEDWRPGFSQGRFAQPDVPSVPGATLVEGLFADTLPSFLTEHSGAVAFLHLDADLYSSTKTVLDLLSDRLVPGTIVLMDEYFNYPGWQDGEYRAWDEFVTANDIRFEYLGYAYDNEQVVVGITGRGEHEGDPVRGETRAEASA